MPRTMHGPSRKIMALDPGGTTGVAILRYGGNMSGYHGEGPGWRFLELDGIHHIPLWKMLTDETPDVIIVERFLNRGNPAAVLVALEYIGVARLYASMTNKQFVEQTSAQAKNLFDNQKLRDLGIYNVGYKHAMDAARHMLYYLTVTLRDDSFLRRIRH